MKTAPRACTHLKGPKGRQSFRFGYYSFSTMFAFFVEPEVDSGG